MFTFTLKFSCHRKKNFIWKKKRKDGDENYVQRQNQKTAKKCVQKNLTK